MLSGRHSAKLLSSQVADNNDGNVSVPASAIFSNKRNKPEPVAFLFLGETLLIPHLYPILESLAKQAATPPIDCWVGSVVHETLIGSWLADAGLTNRVRMRRAPGFQRASRARGRSMPHPAKLPVLVRLAPHLLTARLVVCAEQTSLWLPRIMPFLRWRFIKAAHGAGSMMARRDPRRRAAHRLLVPAQAEKDRLAGVGIANEKVEVVGYVKSGFAALGQPRRLFTQAKRTVVYAPHWQRHRSSWWAWGRQIVTMLAEQSRFNVILSPHQRLVEKAPELRGVLDAVAGLDHVHVDLDSFSVVDGTYLASADIYLGDTSSQVVEFMTRQRPCVFLNPDAIDWRGSPDHDFWRCGKVVDQLPFVMSALNAAENDHGAYADVQRRFVADALGDASAAAADRAAAVIRNCL